MLRCYISCENFFRQLFTTLKNGDLTMPKSRELAQANLENIYRIFTVPEAPDSTLGRIDQAISDDLMGFLQEHIVAVERELDEIEGDFSHSRIPEEPTFVSDYTEFLKEKLVSQSVHTASPGFIGHMTSALPYFMLPLSRILTALNQNLVKVETSRAFTPMERQVLAMIHRLIYSGSDDFYSHVDSEQQLLPGCLLLRRHHRQRHRPLGGPQPPLRTLGRFQGDLAGGAAQGSAASGLPGPGHSGVPPRPLFPGQSRRPAGHRTG